MTAPPEGTRPPADGAPHRPADVDTAFWLWLVALPLMTCEYVVNMLTGPQIAGPEIVYPVAGLTAVVVMVVVATFLMLMRSGYRWARAVLTGGGIGAMVYGLSGLTDADARPSVAVLAAITGIIGSVLIAAGTFLLHRAEANAYFVR
ncbi:hypothetical protein [Mycobacterium sp. UM_Kg1]|uniref:hypothetical protein n=1 Tax=Mycobacterium sp. UM_Kg1 TaxID=1545691 RepID=UPI00061ABA08|nr:hypothetical protein [Mycobacterium sp. UM_Kg1]